MVGGSGVLVENIPAPFSEIKRGASMSVMALLQQSGIVLGTLFLLGEAITPQLQDWTNLVALGDATARDGATPLVNLSTGGYRGSVRLGW